MSHQELPAISGRQLIQLFKKDGWVAGRKAKHGRTMVKDFGSHKKVTFIPEKSSPLPDITLSQILGVKQTGLGKKGLAKLMDKYGL